MTQWFTSDWHISHANIQKYCPDTRPNCTPEAMNQVLMDNITAQVRPGDIIYNLGDVSFASKEVTRDHLMYIKSLGVEHHLIFGNHDHKLRKELDFFKGCFDSVQDIKEITVGKKLIVMCHYSMRVWNRAHHGSWMLFGHSHGEMQVDGKSMDVGLDSRSSGDMSMWSFDEIKDIMSTRERIEHHGD